MNRQRAFLAAGCVLLALAAWLMSRGDRPIKTPPRVEFRHRQGKSALVFEAKALRESPAAKMWLDCMLSKRDREELAREKEEWGFNPLEDVDRLSVASDHVVVAAGDFATVPWDTDGNHPRAYGVSGRIYPPSVGRGRYGIWNGQLLLMGQDDASIEAAIDRLEDRAPPESPPIPDWAAYGDVYGFLDAQEVADSLGPSQQEMADRFRSALQRIELHVDTADDVAITADATGPSPDDVADLGKSLGTALSLGRIKAEAEGDDKLAELLELGRVSPRGREGRFSFDLALPMEVLRRQIGPCPRDGEGGGDGG